MRNFNHYILCNNYNYDNNMMRSVGSTHHTLFIILCVLVHIFDYFHNKYVKWSTIHSTLYSNLSIIQIIYGWRDYKSTTIVDSSVCSIFLLHFLLQNCIISLFFYFFFILPFIIITTLLFLDVVYSVTSINSLIILLLLLFHVVLKYLWT